MAFTTHSYEDPAVLASDIRSRYEFHEVRSACAVMKAVSPEEWEDITDVLEGFSFSANLLLRAGGNNSEMAETLNRALRDRGWRECAYKLETKGKITFREADALDEDLGTMNEASYWVDNRKGRVLVDIEWNAKDGNLDRDLAAYRAWHEAGLIDAAMIITKHREALFETAIKLWAPHLNATYEEVYKATRKAKKARKEEDKRLALPLDLTTTTVTSLTKATDRISRGEAGTCPVVAVGISGATWDGTPYQEMQEGNSLP
ncbi:BglII/BstYI family type II restriction endonuclease [Bifidobacterium favimelis]|uniref:BglII/BstYI family type II restriction endonuclease n=1 Tax=Bifidobacterium favimelis TaxID=3122979 RepID=A0ABU8ZPZ3_9BIFI